MGCGNRERNIITQEQNNSSLRYHSEQLTSKTLQKSVLLVNQARATTNVYIWNEKHGDRFDLEPNMHSMIAICAEPNRGRWQL
jgi:hypothetical protein